MNRAPKSIVSPLYFWTMLFLNKNWLIHYKAISRSSSQYTLRDIYETLKRTEVFIRASFWSVSSEPATGLYSEPDEFAHLFKLIS
jgi:hypothetical protein